MKRDQLWLTVPQAVVLEATRKIDVALDLKDNDPQLLIIKANRLLAPRTVVPLELDTEEHRVEAFQKFQEEKSALRGDSRYLQIQQRVHDHLVVGVTTKASKAPDGPYETVDPVEFTRVELRGVDAIDRKTRNIKLYGLRIDAFHFIESLTGKPIGAATATSSGEVAKVHQHPSLGERWECTGDPLPKLLDWARSNWGDNLQQLPGRKELLQFFRGRFGRVHGVNEKTMGELRRQLAPEQARRGGAPTHRRYLGK